MNCFFHDDTPAIVGCAKCGVGLCRNCMTNAVYTIDGKPICLNCSKPIAQDELNEAQSSRTWSLVKFIFSGFFIGIGLIALADGAELAQVWIISGVAGIPTAFKATRRTREQRIMDEIQDRYERDIINLMFGWMIRLLIKVAFMVLLAPICASYTCISNLIKFLKSKKKIAEAEAALAHIDQCLCGEGEPLAEQPSGEQLLPERPASSNEAYQPKIPAQQAQQTQTESNFVNAQTPQTFQVPQAFSNPAQTPPSQTASASKRSGSKMVVAVVAVLLLAGGIFSYFFCYVPYAKDHDALRTYVLANNVFLRSSEMAGVEYNVLGKVPYGSELITYTKGREWASVKVNGVEGYVSSPYLLIQSDFALLNGVWGDMDAKDCIESSKCRLAILDFFKRNQLASGTTGWQIYTRTKNQKPNAVFYPRLFNKNSKFTDFVFVAKDNASGNRMLACYSFEDETEAPIYRFSASAPTEGYIKNVTASYSGAKILFNTSEIVNISF